MSNHARDLFHLQRAKLASVAPHWAQAIQEGDPLIGWLGDRFLQLSHDVITDEIVIEHVLPDRKPVLVFRVPAVGFDIKRVCTLLRDADHRMRSRAEIADEVDKHNAKIMTEQQYRADQRMEAAKEKMRWALRKDTGNHIAPILVTKNPVRV